MAEENKGTFDEIYEAFAKLGDKMSGGTSITKENIDKWLKEADILDGDKVTSDDTTKYYEKVAKDSANATKDQFNEFLDTLAKEKDMKPEEMKEKLGKVSNPGESSVAEKVKDVAGNLFNLDNDSDESSDSKDKDKK